MQVNDFLLRDQIDREQHALKPEDVAPLRRYIEHRIPTGGFFRAVLENDLQDACARGDFYHRRRLFEFVLWLEEHAPSNAWGSPRLVKAWLAEEEDYGRRNTEL